MAECLAPSPQPKGKTPESAKSRKPPHKTMEKGKFVHQAIEISPPPNGEEGTPAQGFTLYDSDNEGKDNPLVSETICRFIIKSKLAVPKTGAQGEVEAIIDTGCTRCLISLPTVLKLGIRMKTDFRLMSR